MMMSWTMVGVRMMNQRIVMTSDLGGDLVREPNQVSYSLLCKSLGKVETRLNLAFTPPPFHC